MKRTTSLVLAVLLPAVVLAQGGAIQAAKDARQKAEATNKEQERAADAASSGQAGAPATPATPTPAPAEGAAPRVEGAATAPDRGMGAVPPPDTYTIRPGDTLWDLSGRFLNNPWYWPKVWSYNPEITNPHWIEPGNVLKFYPGAEEAPGRVEPAPPGVVVSPEEPAEPTLEPPRELEDFSRANMKEPVPVEDQDEVNVAGPYKVGYVAPRAVMIRRETFVTPREVEEAGTLVAAFEEKVMLSSLDRAYAHFKGPAPARIGEAYLIFRTARAVRHPFTNELLGYQTTILGTAKVVAVDAKAATLIIGQTLEPIERGDLLGPWTEKLVRPVARRPNTKELKGHIVGAQVDVMTQLGEQHLVFVDKGKADGVEEGNIFRVVRSGDPLGLEGEALTDDPRLPTEIMGDLLVVDVKDHVSTALVTKSLRELVIGDRVEMHAAGPGGG
jgi:hypothetical protein